MEGAITAAFNAAGAGGIERIAVAAAREQFRRIPSRQAETEVMRKKNTAYVFFMSR
ncbi:MAG: hypothetical protein KF712_04410 [Akkermansiaceae bacterium]|nr:hypothetical protein [Akkermansiaceae bacterium]